MGNNCIKSLLNFKQTSSISTVRMGGPRTVYWDWKLSDCEQGSSTLELLDNGLPTGFSISEIDKNNWHSCAYDIKDASKHELKWIHKNNWGTSTARIEGVCITPPAILFSNAKVDPSEEILASAIVDSHGFYESPNSSYKVDVDTKLPYLDINLFIILPNNERVLRIPKVIDGRNNTTIIWDSIKLCNNDLGFGKFWFEATFNTNDISQSDLDELILRIDPRVYKILERSDANPIKSEIFSGPNITNIIVQAGFSGDRVNRIFCATLTGTAKTTIGLITSDDGISWKSANGTILSPYTHVGELQEFCFTLPRNDPLKKSYEFAVNGARN